MAEQDNSPIDPFEDLYVRTEDTNPLQTPLPPEMMAMTLEEALLRGCQRCVFTRFMPGMHLCTADTVSTIANASNSINWNIGARWTFDTYVKAAEPGRRGKYYRNHEHQCIMANVIDDLYLGYTGGDPDAPVHRMDASTGAAESQERVDRTATRIALAAYQRAATPRVVRRVAMVYGSEYEGVYRKKLMGDFDKEFNRETIRDGRPTAVDLAALRQLPFTPEAVPLQYQPSASPRHPRHVYDHISILVVNVPQRHLDEDIMPLTDSMLRFRADPQETETPSLSVQSSEYVATEMD